MKNFFSVKELVKKIKRQATDQKKIPANHIVDEGLISRICKKNTQNLTFKKSHLKNRQKT